MFRTYLTWEIDLNGFDADIARTSGHVPLSYWSRLSSEGEWIVGAK